MELTRFALIVMTHVREYVQPAFKEMHDALDSMRTEFNKKISELPKPEKGERGEKGDPGEKGDAGEPGAPGEQGLKGDQGERGEKGEKGESGGRGDDGKPGERGEPGAKGERGEQGHPGEAGAKGEAGEKGLDGKSVTAEEVVASLEPHIAKWALDFERRAQDILQRSVDQFPRPKDGLDGLGFENIEAIDSETEFGFKFVLGDREKTFKWAKPKVTDSYRGVWASAETYAKGDAVTWGGSLFIAVRDPDGAKPETDDSWKLAVKRGRDGRDGVAKSDGPRTVKIA